MALMNKMRENTKTILLILVFAFILTIIIDWGAGGLKSGPKPGVIGVVNGEEILHEEFSKAYQEQLAAYRERTGAEPEGYQLTSLENQVWERLVQSHLLGQIVKDRGIYATDQEILDEIFHNPPEFLKESFKDSNGVFNREKYEQAIQQGSPTQWRTVENILRANLPYQKLDRQIRATARVTDDEARLEFIKENINAKVDYILYDVNSFQSDSNKITEAEIKNYYEEHKEDFRQPERRKLNYVLFELKTTPQDSAEIRALAQDLLRQAKSGDDFAELAQTYSEDPGSGSKGGDLGYFGKGAMVKPFEEAAFAAKKGEIVGPVESRFGLHIIKVEDKKYEDGELKVKARHILLKFQPSANTRENISYSASYLAEYAKDVGLEAAAEAESLQVQSTDFFQKGGFIPGIGMERGLARWTFASKVGEVSKVIYTENGYIVASLAAVDKEHIKPLEEVKTEIVRRLQANQRMELAKAKCLKAFEKIKSGYALDQVAEEDSLEIKHVDSFKMTGYIPGVGREPAFVGVVFAMDDGEISKPVKGTRGYYLIQLIEKDKFEQDAFERQKAAIKNRILQQRRQAAYSKWYSKLKEHSEIKDFRDVYYY